MRVLSRHGVEILHNRILDLEKAVAELQENFDAMRTLLEAIRDAVADEHSPPADENKQ